MPPRPRRPTKPPPSPWRSTPQALRRSPKRQFTLTPEAIDVLERAVAAEDGATLSGLVERAILQVYGAPVPAKGKSTGGRR